MDRIELYPGKFYQVKLIDFGLVVKGKESLRRCQGGTSGFAPSELLTNSPHNKIDVFSMAMSMLDFELASDRLDYFSDIHEVWFESTRFKRNMTKEEKTKILQLSWFKIATVLSSNPSYKEAFNSKIREMFPKIDDFLKKVFQGKTLEDLPLKNYLFGNKDIMRVIMIATVEVYYENYYSTEKFPKTLLTYVDKIKEIESRLSEDTDKDSDQHEQLNESLKYYINDKAIYEGSFKLRMDYIKYLLSEIKKNANKRSSLQEFRDELLKIRTEFENNFESELKYVLMYKRYNLSNSLNSSIKRENSMSSFVNLMKQKRPSFRLDDSFRLLI
jgi:hypothetical protein